MMNVIIFLTIFLSIYFSSNFYIARRIKKVFIKENTRGKKVIAFYLIYFTATITTFGFMGLPVFVPFFIESFVYNFAGIWIYFYMYMLVLVILTDIISLIYRFVKKEKLENAKKSKAYKLYLIIFSLAIVMGNQSANTVKLVEYDVNLTENEEYETINAVLITDTHFGSAITTTKANELVQMVNKQKPDIIFIAGDIFDSGLGRIRDQEALKEALSKLEAKDGVYVSLGNHDAMREDPKPVIEFLESANMTVLTDEYIEVKDNLLIVGRYDLSFKEERQKLEEYLPDRSDRENKSIIVIDHQPVDFDELRDEKVDMIVSGHTHNGQVFPATFIVSKLFDNSYGYKILDGLHSVTSSGFGTWGARVRIGTQSEIVKLNIKY